MQKFAAALFGLIVFCGTAHASTVLIPLPNLPWNGAILSPGLILGKSGVHVSSHGGNARSGGSFWNLRGAFPLESSDEARISGWVWGFGVGTTLYGHVPGVVLVPSTYFWEIMAGRGTTEIPTGGGSGIRGYLEVALRDQRPQRDNQLNTALNEMGAQVEEHSTSLAIRMGATSDFAGLGLVEQHPPRISYRIESSVYLPMADYKRLYLTLQTEALTACGMAGLGCGVAIHFMQSSNAQKMGSAAELYRHIAYGGLVEYRWRERYALTALVQWNWLIGNDGGKNARTHLRSSVPSLDLTGVIGF